MNDITFKEFARSALVAFFLLWFILTAAEWLNPFSPKALAEILANQAVIFHAK